MSVVEIVSLVVGMTSAPAWQAYGMGKDGEMLFALPGCEHERLSSFLSPALAFLFFATILCGAWPWVSFFFLGGACGSFVWTVGESANESGATDRTRRARAFKPILGRQYHPSDAEGGGPCH